MLLVEPMACRLRWYEQLIMGSSLNPMYRKAASRRANFESREEAAAYFASRRAFKRWHPEAIRALVDGGYDGVGDGERTQLPSHRHARQKRKERSLKKKKGMQKKSEKRCRR